MSSSPQASEKDVNRTPDSFTDRLDSFHAPDELIQFTLNHFADMAFWIRLDGRFIYVNETTCSLLGYSHDELLSMHVWDIDPQFPPERWKEHWAELREQGVVRMESKHHTKSGLIIPVQITTNYIQHDGEEYNFAFARDMRPQIRSERLINALTRAGREVDRALTYDAMFHATARELALIDFKTMLLLLDESGERLYTTYIGVDRAIVDAIEKLVGVHQDTYSFPVDRVEGYRPVVREGETFITSDVVSVMRDVLPRPFKGFARQLTAMLGFDTLIAVPFLVEDEIHGVLSVQGKDLTEVDIPAITAFSQHLAAAWRKASLYEIAQQEIEERKLVEKQMRIERDRAETYLNTMAVMLVALDMDYCIHEINQRGIELLDLHEDDVHGKAFLDEFVPEKMRVTFQDYLQRIQQGTLPTHADIEIPVQSRSGREHLIYWRTSPIQDLDGTVIGLLASGEDVTMRKRAEDALRESEERFRMMTENISDGLTILEDNKIAYINNRLCEILGYSRSDIMRMELTQFAAPQEADRVKDFLRNIDSLNAKGETFELWIERKDGTRRYIQNRFSRDSRNLHQNRYYVVSTDITDQKHAVEEQERLLARIQYQASQVQQVINTVPEGVILIDEDMHYIQSNLLGSMHLEKLAKVNPGDKLAALGDDSLLPILEENDDVVWHDISHGDQVYEAAAQPLIGPKAVQGWVLILREVTRERQERAHTYQQERLASIGLLAGGIAHDFNNALMPITLYAEILLKDETISPRSRERLETILAQAKHAGALTQQILDFSRRSILERISLDLTGLVREQVRLFKRTLPESIRIELDYDHRDHIVNVDATRIQQALMNLALNARDAMPEGGLLRLRVDSLAIEDQQTAPVPSMLEGEWVRLLVQDTGTGIAEEDLGYIFEPFFTTKKPGDGSGLGLAQVYGIVKQHDGEIEVESKLGEGTTFHIYLPEVTLPLRSDPVKISQLPKGEREVLLVVEDDSTVRQALTDVLEALNYVTLEAEHGRAALDILSTRKDIDLILSDVVMPEMGGKELFRILRGRGDPRPFVMMTGHPLKDELDELLAGDVSGWMVKSEGTDRLAHLLQDVLKSKI